jgi:hypothetical protein
MKMSSTVVIASGSYRGQEIVNQEFTLVKGYTEGKNGGFVTVKNEGQFDIGISEIRIKVGNINNVKFADGHIHLAPGAQVTTEQEPEVIETDDEAIERMRLRFNMLDKMTQAAVDGDIRAMVVSGPPGVGKSFGVERIIDKACMIDKLKDRPLRAEVVKGAITPVALFTLLYKYSDSKNVLVFDDCDAVFSDEVTLNLLKGALDTGKNRKISWLADSKFLRAEGIPDSFNFNGSIVFLTNLNFANVKSKRMQDHLAALESRCHFIDLKINSARDKVLRLKQAINDGLLDSFDFSDAEKAEVTAFVVDNAPKLRELSLRTAIKCAQLRKSFPTDWTDYANVSLIKNS